MLRISIITVTYNSAGTIAHAIQSVQQQSYPHIEHVIVDGLSADGTLDIVRSFSHIKTVISEKDNGMYDAMNKGIGLASGEIIGILNSDDFYPDETVIHKVVEKFQNNDCDAVYGDLIYVDEKKVKKVKRKWIAGHYKKGSFLHGWMPPHPTFFVRKKIYEQYGLFNLQLGTAADYEMMLRLMHRHEINTAYVNEVIVHMRAGGLSNKSFGNRLNANQNDRMAWIVNNLKPYPHTLYLKPLRKIGQFLTRGS